MHRIISVSYNQATPSYPPPERGGTVPPLSGGEVRRGLVVT
jgi:hypothetical protein